MVVVLNTLQFLAILLTAVSMAPGWAHLLELPNKLGLSKDEYLTVQQIYRGWAYLGIAVEGHYFQAGPWPHSNAARAHRSTLR
jgi:hypothetical protein